MATILILTQVVIQSEVIFEVPFRIKLPEPSPPTTPPPDEPAGFLAELIADFLKFIDKLPEIPEFRIPTLPCPVSLGTFPLPSIPPFPKIPLPVSKTTPPPDEPAGFLAELIADFLKFIDSLPEIPEFKIPTLPCPIGIGVIPLPTIPPFPKIPLPVSKTTPPPDEPAGFLAELIADFLKFIDKLPEIPEYKFPALPCPVQIGLPVLNITATVEP
jgi:hypothetical protein